MEHKVLLETRAWVQRVVIGLNLCPFAKAPQARGRVRYALSEATDEDGLLSALAHELQRLASTPEAELETTLLVHPQVLGGFEAYNQFLDLADEAVQALGLEGVLQVASFHPDYCFAGTEPGDVGNATNRSPYPLLHLLRESSISRAVEAGDVAQRIIEANQATLQRLGPQGLALLREQCRADAWPGDAAS